VRDYGIGFFPAAFRFATLDLLPGTPGSSLALPWPALLLAEVGMTILLFSTSPNLYTLPRHASRSWVAPLVSLHPVVSFYHSCNCAWAWQDGVWDVVGVGVFTSRYCNWRKSRTREMQVCYDHFRTLQMRFRLFILSLLTAYIVVARLGTFWERQEITLTVEQFSDPLTVFRQTLMYARPRINDVLLSSLVCSGTVDKMACWATQWAEVKGDA